MNDKSKGSYAQVNGLNLYYEVHGEGEPLVLLHGGIGAIEMFGPVLPLFAESRQVIGVDLQAHGRTADIDRPMTFEAMADDIAALLDQLGLQSADVLGYSLGGGVAQQTALRHPERVRKLVVVSSPCKWDGWYPDVRAGMAQVGAAAAEPMKQSPIYQLYSQIAPRPEDWPILLTKVGKLIQTDYNWTEGIAALKSPVLIVIGDADSVRPTHAVEFFELLGGGQGDAGWDGSGFVSNSRLAILPAATHYNILSAPTFLNVVVSFLDAPMPKPE